MALSVLLRNTLRTPGLQRALQITPVAVNNFAKFSQLTSHAENSSTILSKSCSGLPLINPYLPSVSAVQKFHLSPVRRSEEDEHSHAFMWTLERVLSGALVFIVPATFLMCNPVMDNIFALAVAAHSHWGVEAICQDYIRPIIFGSIFPKIALIIVYCLSASVLGGLLYYNYNDIGISETFKRYWSNQTKKEEKPAQKTDPKKK